MSLTDTFDNPQSRVEAILQNAMGAEHEVVPQSRVEELLERLDDYLENIEGKITDQDEEIVAAVNAWLEDNFSGDYAVTDKTLTVSGMAADAKASGDRIGQLKSEFVDVEQAVGYEIIELQNNKTINTSGGTNVTPDHMQTENNWCGCCVPCSEGDLFTITGGGGNSTRLWAFANSSGVVLEQADASAYGTNLKKTAPENSAYFAFNSRKSDSPFVYRGTKPVELFDVRPTTEDLKNIVGYTVNNLFDGIGTTIKP